ncbi:MAG TPA: ABC transporter permease [Ornithinibacter sp.]|jgi:oligopeptide transport system permease protein|uniref:ABC transporter permease n=1 Tax=Ornithinibacter sp. TaxID=2862748 RepID=UPI001B5FD602|nr:ABC transporter permease [Ornithinibacter sp.]MBP6524474.1 ABC transporter permease [Dermatophilaceae bacterium]MBU9943137.1 ABC transporter permease [Dermatophilaceae bacterium]HQV81934.1 ABC transporter permease [Ornithinibacter sp.]HQW72494.1 ABC transporter permease [Ornithinibacter sp.]HQX86131.1 ABC transporter permease [Ornithinibacter sp.]
MTEAAAVVSETVAPNGSSDENRSLASDAWRSLRKNPIFWASAVLISIFVLMAIFPSLFTSTDPREAVLAESRSRPGDGTWFGRDIQGYDIYARCIYGARASILVGVLTTILTVSIGGFIGVMSGYLGGAADAVMSRVGDVFFAIPLLLGAIIFLVSLPDFFSSNAFLGALKVSLALAVLGWPSMARLMRSSVIQVKPNDYVQAARALGASPSRIVRSHILPNSVAPLIVVATISLGGYIAAEATLSFLGIGLQAPAVSWGIDISAALVGLRTTPHMLFFPSLFLSLAVLGFILLGDAVRDALDPKNR